MKSIIDIFNESILDKNLEDNADTSLIRDRRDRFIKASRISIDGSNKNINDKIIIDVENKTIHFRKLHMLDFTVNEEVIEILDGWNIGDIDGDQCTIFILPNKKTQELKFPYNILPNKMTGSHPRLYTLIGNTKTVSIDMKGIEKLNNVYYWNIDISASNPPRTILKKLAFDESVKNLNIGLTIDKNTEFDLPPIEGDLGVGKTGMKEFVRRITSDPTTIKLVFGKNCAVGARVFEGY